MMYIPHQPAETNLLANFDLFPTHLKGKRIRDWDDVELEGSHAKKLRRQNEMSLWQPERYKMADSSSDSIGGIGENCGMDGTRREFQVHHVPQPDIHIDTPLFKQLQKMKEKICPCTTGSGQLILYRPPKTIPILKGVADEDAIVPMDLD